MRFFDRPLSRYPLTAVSDYRLAAKKRIPSQLFEFLEGGAFDEITMKRNGDDFQQIQLKRRVLKDVSNLKMGIDLFGQKMDFPLVLSPIGFAGIFAHRGEVQAAKAAVKASIPFTLSTVSICSIEEVARSVGPFWFQCYLFKDRHHSLDLLQRAQAVHCPVLILTVDLPMAGARYRYHRSRKRSRMRDIWDTLMHFPWWMDVRARGKPLTMGNMPHSAPALSDLASMRQWMGTQLNLCTTWKDFDWVREHWKGKILVKGILDPEDAIMALRVGADGIIVSNHGGRHVDGTLSTIGALPFVCEAVKGQLKILLDGGITSGLDMAKALSIGADACMIGKSWVYGLAAYGEQGVSDILKILHNELKIVMTHLGLSSIDEITRDLLVESNGKSR